MMNRCRFIFLGVLLMVSGVAAQAQQRCGTAAYVQKTERQNPAIALGREKLEEHIGRLIESNAGQRNAAEVITIPVVFHVVYRTDQENISEAQVLSQLAVLNQDFRRRNADTLNTPLAFAGAAADTEIEFCLAHTDPYGYYTSGITRTRTSLASFTYDTDDKVKYSNLGGRDAWDSDKYLNVWVCNLDKNTLGYSSMPGWAKPVDGVVVDFEAFGTTGTAKAPFNRGRTLTHEVGHWLNLSHIWGPDDTGCREDGVSDTPMQQSFNYNCPIYPHRPNSCGTSNLHGDMFMNYMDYTNDACMNLFTLGQKNRMRASINFSRPELKTSGACSNGIEKPTTPQTSLVLLSPNPTNRLVQFSFAENKTAGPYTIRIYDQVGRLVQSLQSANLLDNKLYADMSVAANGIYTAHIEADGLSEKIQFVVIH